MGKLEKQINLIAQNKIDFDEGQNLIIKSLEFDFNVTFEILKNFILNSIPNKSNYFSDSYQKAIISIPLKQTFTPIIILNKFSVKDAFKRLSELSESEYEKIIISLLWIFKITDTERRQTECKNGCEHYWHNIK
ncbi:MULTISPECIES: DUF5958 family protein [unclassified Kaistella]|uniref:DUF5958 family protein n=1 Tax=unclassified Kaistella TaxID=2762626 RepID=UPI002734B8A8|nr:MULTISPECIES: DUF5958 family protein [unclassified Kaistella]MDP2455371.1 DUF5958 family protein [Kaistella sp. SH11-4b]MDP2458285.1 DUF5958 family protein [Kaistella sp. SH40-3]MDP2461189.1 DUF5958 family protein [Kaistella sp. SH19-2b]